MLRSILSYKSSSLKQKKVFQYQPPIKLRKDEEQQLGTNSRTICYVIAFYPEAIPKTRTSCYSLNISYV